MEERDLPRVLEIERLSFSHPWEESAFRGEIGNRGISFPWVIVVSPGGKIAGYLLIWLVENEAQISNFALHPDFRGRGIGREVLEKKLQSLRRMGARSVILEVRPTNFTARRLYAHLGFKPLAIRKNYYRNPVEDALVMIKRFE
jgi:ribosomal-protein-alanine N-acetyltransferase